MRGPGVGSKFKHSTQYTKEGNNFLTFFSCFLQAKKACKALGSANLATIEDNTANNFIKGKLSANAWTGATDVATVSTVAPQLRVKDSTWIKRRTFYYMKV